PALPWASGPYATRSGAILARLGRTTARASLPRRSGSEHDRGWGQTWGQIGSESPLRRDGRTPSSAHDLSHMRPHAADAYADRMNTGPNRAWSRPPHSNPVGDASSLCLRRLNRQRPHRYSDFSRAHDVSRAGTARSMICIPEPFQLGTALVYTP